MTALALVIAALLTVGLIATSTGALSRSVPVDRRRRGAWGIVERTRARSRRLDAHERRWETTLISAREQDTRWPDAVAEIRRLETAVGLEAGPPPPETFDARWIENRLTLIEEAVAEHEPGRADHGPMGDTT